MSDASRLIVLRGPSAAGKSTVAAELARQCPDKTAVLEEDYFRRIILQRRDDDRTACKRMLRECALVALDAGFHVLLEGILVARHYEQVVADLLAHNPGTGFLFYFDVSLAESLNRHRVKPIADVVPESSLREWYGAAAPLQHTGEKIIPETWTVQQAVDFIQVTAGLGALP